MTTRGSIPDWNVSVYHLLSHQRMYISKGLLLISAHVDLWQISLEKMSNDIKHEIWVFMFDVVYVLAK